MEPLADLWLSSLWRVLKSVVLTKLAGQIMATRTHPEHGYRACLGIIRLADKYGTARLEAAAGRALAVRTLTYRSVASILANGLDSQPLPISANRVHPAHPNLRGPHYYQ